MDPRPQAPAAPSPLSAEEVNRLDATLLPALERHHLRLLAHGLRTLQAIGQQHPGQSCGLPDGASLEAWARQQQPLQADPAFSRTFCQQLLQLGTQLDTIARPLGLAPLELELEHLIAWADQQARSRLQSQP